MKRRIATIVAITVSAIAGAALIPIDGPIQERRLGTISFANSGNAEAQRTFIEGVLLMHSFEFEDAATAFRAAQEIDADFALAYWGEAMTYNHPLWRQQDKAAAIAAARPVVPSCSATSSRTVSSSSARTAGLKPVRSRSTSWWR